jgi:hypothetical protein
VSIRNEPAAPALAPVPALILVLALASTARAAPSSILVTSDSSDGPGSLRAAIDEANADGVETHITFASGLTGSTIRLAWGSGELGLHESFPTTVDGDIDGNGTPDVTIDVARTSWAGLNVSTDGNTVRGLVIMHASGPGIFVSGSGNTIEGCRLIENGGQGVSISGGPGNIVKGCRIGTDASGAARLGNADAGVLLHDGASGNTVGPDNVIAWNNVAGWSGGIALFDGAIPGAYPAFAGLTPDWTETIPSIDFPGTRGAFTHRNGTVPTRQSGHPFGDFFGARFTASLEVGVAGVYAFRLREIDDDVNLWIDGAKVYEAHCCGEQWSPQFTLTQGAHPFRLDYQDGPAHAALVLEIVRADGSTAAPEEAALHYGGGPGVFAEFFDLRVPTERNTITRNSVYENGGLGIEVDAIEEGNGVNFLDPGDGDIGPNTALNHPVIASASPSGGQLLVSGTAPPSAKVEVFGAAPDDSSHGEGKHYLGTLDSDGTGAFSGLVDAPPAGTSSICATATDADGNTSEFSRNHVAGAPPPNDEPGGAIPLAAGARLTLDTSAATTSPGVDYSCVDGETYDVWFEYSPASDELLTIETRGSSYDTFIAVFAGSASPGAEIECWTYGPNRNGAATRTVAVSGGTKYLIAIGSHWSGGGTLRLALSSRAPGSDIRVLLYESGGGGGMHIALGALMECGAIRAYDVYDERSFKALTTAQIAAYRVVLAGWQGFHGHGSGFFNGNATGDGGAGLKDNPALAAAITGKIALTCFDPDLHYAFGGANPEGESIEQLENLIAFAASGDGTGFVGISDPVGNFGYLPAWWGVTADGGGGEDALVSDATHPLNTTPNVLSSSGLSHIRGSYHNRFTSVPAGFAVVQRSHDGTPLTIGGDAPEPPPSTESAPADAPEVSGLDALVYDNAGGIGEIHAMYALMKRETVRMYSVWNRRSFPSLAKEDIRKLHFLFVGWSGFFWDWPSPTNGNGRSDGYEGLLANAEVWRESILGNAVVSGKDPDLHFGGHKPEELFLLENGAVHAAAAERPGIFCTSDAMTAFGYLGRGPRATLRGGEDVVVVDPDHSLNKVPNTLTTEGLANTGGAYHNTFLGTAGVTVVHANSAGEPITWVGHWPDLPLQPEPDFSLPTADGEHLVWVGGACAGNIFLDFQNGSWHYAQGETGDGDDAVRLSCPDPWFQVLGDQVAWIGEGWGENIEVPTPGGSRTLHIALGWDASGSRSGWMDALSPGDRWWRFPFSVKFLVLRERGGNVRVVKMRTVAEDAFGRIALRIGIKNHDAAEVAVQQHDPMTYPEVPAYGAPSGLPPFEMIQYLGVDAHRISPALGSIGAIFRGPLAPGSIGRFAIRRNAHDGTGSGLYVAGDGDVDYADVTGDRGGTYTIVHVPYAEVEAAITLGPNASYDFEMLDGAPSDPAALGYAPYSVDADATPPAAALSEVEATPTDLSFHLDATDTRDNWFRIRIESDWSGEFRDDVVQTWYDENVNTDWTNEGAIFDLDFSFSGEGGELEFYDGVTYRLAVEDGAGNVQYIDLMPYLAGLALRAPPPPADHSLPTSDGDHVVFLHGYCRGGNFFLDFKAGNWHQMDTWGQGDGDDAVQVNCDADGQQFLGAQVLWLARGWTGDTVQVPLPDGGTRTLNIPTGYDAWELPPAGLEPPLGEEEVRGTGNAPPKYVILRDLGGYSLALVLKPLFIDQWGRIVVRYTVKRITLGELAAIDPSDPATLPGVARTRPAELPAYEPLHPLASAQHVAGPAQGYLGVVLAGAASDIASFSVRREPWNGSARSRVSAPSFTVEETLNSRGDVVTLVYAPIEAFAGLPLGEGASYRLDIRNSDGWRMIPWRFDFDASAPLIEASSVVVYASEFELNFDLRATDREGCISIGLEVYWGGEWVPASRGSYDPWFCGVWNGDGHDFEIDPEKFSFTARGATLQLWKGATYRITLTDQAGNVGWHEFTYDGDGLPMPEPPEYTFSVADGEGVLKLWPDCNRGPIFLNFAAGTLRYGSQWEPQAGDGIRVHCDGAWQDAFGGQFGWAFNGFVGERVDVPRKSGQPRRMNIPSSFHGMGPRPNANMFTVPAGGSGLHRTAPKYLLFADRSMAVKLKFRGQDGYGRYIFHYGITNVPAAERSAINPSNPATLPAVPPAGSAPATGLPPAEMVGFLSPSIATWGRNDGFVGYFFDGVRPEAEFETFEVRREPGGGLPPAKYEAAPDVRVVEGRTGRLHTMVSVPVADIQDALGGLDEASFHRVRVLGPGRFDYAAHGVNFDLSPPIIDWVNIASTGETDLVAAMRARDRSFNVLVLLQSDRSGTWRNDVEGALPPITALGAVTWNDNLLAPGVGPTWDGSHNVFENSAFSFAQRGAAPTFYKGVNYRIVFLDPFLNGNVLGTFTVPNGRDLPPEGRVLNERTGLSFRFVLDALLAAESGDVITLSGGTYRETAYVDGRHAGTEAEPTRVRAAPGADVVIDAENRRRAGIIALRAHHARFEGIRIEGAGLAGVYAHLSRGFVASGCEVSGSFHGYDYEEAPEGEVSFSIARDNARYGLIFVNWSPDAYIHHNLVYGNTRAGISLQGFSPGGRIHNNTVHGNGHFGGVFVFNGCTGTDIRNNIVTGSTGVDQMLNGVATDPSVLGVGIADLGAAFGGASSAPLAIAYNDVHGNVTSYVGVTDPTGTSGNISADPLYVNADAPAGPLDFHLAPESPAIDAGDPSFPSGNEPAGSAGRIDMGRYGNTPEATVKAPSGNQPPLADAGPDQTITCAPAAGALVALSGAGSSDPDEGASLAYEWFEGDAKIAAGVAPTVLLAPGTHAITLVVSDGAVTDDDDVTVTVEADTTAPQVTAALEPVAHDRGHDRGRGRGHDHGSWPRRYLVRASADDGCDGAPAVLAYMKLPDVAGLRVEWKRTSRGHGNSEPLSKITVKRHGRTMRVRVQGPDPQGLWASLVREGGVPVGVAVEDGQRLELRLRGEHDDERDCDHEDDGDDVHSEFVFRGTRLVLIKGGPATLVVEGRDDAGNVARAEASR